MRPSKFKWLKRRKEVKKRNEGKFELKDWDHLISNDLKEGKKNEKKERRKIQTEGWDHLTSNDLKEERK